MSLIKDQEFTLDRFLKFPEVKPALEFYGGGIVQKMSPKYRHSILHTEFLLKLTLYAKPEKVGKPFVELRCVFGGAAFVFDISFFVQHRIPNVQDVENEVDVLTPPDLVVEVLSRGQTIGAQIKRLRLATDAGVRCGWLIDSRNQRVLVVRPGQETMTLTMGDILSHEEILPGFALPVAEIFGWLS